MPLILLWLVFMGVWIVAIVDVSRQPPDAFPLVRRSKGATVILVVVTGWVGAAYYAMTIRPALVQAAATRPVVADDGTQYCLDCDMPGYPADAERCTNCGSQRLAPSSARRRR